MNVKIQGGDKAYANTGSCLNIAYYLEHEDYHRLEKGLEVETFFSQDKDDIKKRAFVMEMDNNKAKLCKKDAKFYVLTISPSEKEIKNMGNTEEQRSKAFKEFIRKDVMNSYANGFGKNLVAEDLLYFAKIHHSRNENDIGQMHAHIVVSRKTKDNRIKISPKTNHRKAKTAGTVKSGFDRTLFYQKVEDSFDKMFSYQRVLEEQFEYLNVVKNGSIEDLEKVVNKHLLYEHVKHVLAQPTIEAEHTQTDQITQKQAQYIDTSMSPINYKELDEEEPLLPKRKKKKGKSRDRDYGISM